MFGGLDCDWSGVPGDPATPDELCEAHFGKIYQVQRHNPYRQNPKDRIL
jgi:hypothetical protein